MSTSLESAKSPKSSPSTNSKSTPTAGARALSASATPSRLATPEAPSLAPGTGNRRLALSGEPARPDEHVVGVGEIAEVFAIHEQQIDADRRRACLERIGDAKQDGDAGGAVVGAGHRQPALGAVRRLVRMWPRVPMGQQQDALGGVGLEPREKVAQVQRRAAARQAMIERLDDDGIGPRPQLALQPVTLLFVRRCPGNPRSECDLLLEVRERVLAVELATRSAPRGLAREQQRHGAGSKEQKPA